ncbi:glycogen synthase [Geobacter sp. SVR]|uniref:glycogen synthase n=1 Tax=Geobacter sp. SVR TaxID=2495594 RepID=UPI00143F030C|nr:glycogen/starch synthase [Geobacter sp. SVR]BCS51744.1 glycogen synthase 1 [Geobacter sp. SVR]GCF84931.1 glycogen synthase 1 [Geobacter sp. SVR]
MKKSHESLSILFTAAEAAPFAKEGGLGDVVGALPKYLAAMGHDVRVVIPRYYGIDRDKFQLRLLPGVLVVPMGIIGYQYCGVYEGRLPGSDVPIYFLEHEGYYGRAGLYQQDGRGYMDNDNRFVFLSKASLELCKMLRFTPDVVHAHDWHTAAAAFLLNTSYRHDRFVGEAGSLLSLHNMQHQGNFYPGLMEVLGIGWKHFNYLELEKDDQVNLLKGGIYHATLLNTVSQGYAAEIQTPEHGWGLEGVLAERRADLFGILNGVDYQEWNPESDPFIAATYSARTVKAGKAACKRDLQAIMGLPQRADVPLLGVVSRMVRQKGTDILAEAIHRILEMDVQFVVVGNGEPWAHFYFGDIAAMYPEKFACFIGYDESLAHKVEAGADFFVMPSAFEPCGLNQMYSLAYGTPPIVRATGGLEDSVQNFDETRLAGTGFKFRHHSAAALFDTVGWAVYTYYNNPKGLAALIKNGMAQRFTWEDAASRYEELYRLAIRRRRGEEYYRNRFGG